MNPTKEEYQKSLNGAKKLKRMLKKITWEKIIDIITDIAILISKMKMYKKLYISCREFLSKQTPVGDKERKKWESDDGFIQLMEKKYL